MTMPEPQKVASITGASQGIGAEFDPAYKLRLASRTQGRQERRSRTGSLTWMRFCRQQAVSDG